MVEHRPADDDGRTGDDEPTTVGSIGRRTYMKATAAGAVGALTLSQSDEYVGTAAADVEQDPAPERFEIGGGIEYNNDVTRSDGDYYVDSKSGLKSALDSAGSGDVIWVENYATIDLTGEKSLSLESGATLASARGIDGQRGALLHVDQGMNGGELFKCANESGIRFTGLQFRGPHPYYFCPDGAEPYDDEYVAELATCIWNYSNDSGYTAEIDNCHLWGWSERAIAAGANSYENSIHVHHCSIHHNAIEHLGYGIDLNNGPNHLIEYNYFEMNRHCICGFGQPTNGYEARYNYIGGGEETVDHPFDMHCQASNGSYGHNAGGTIYIHHNTFEPERMISTSSSECDNYTRDGSPETMIQIGDEPADRCDIDNNWFMRKPKAPYDSTGGNGYAYNQSHVDSWSSMYVSDNVYDQLSEPSKSVGHPRPETALDFHSATAVDVNGNGNSSGVHFQVDNTTDADVTVYTVTVSPYEDHQNFLSDAVLDEGRWASEVHIEATQNSTCDIYEGTTLPTEINLVDDNDEDSSDTWAKLGAGTTADTYLYRFYYESGGSYYERDMAGEEVAVSLWYHRYDTDEKERATARLQL